MPEPSRCGVVGDPIGHSLSPVLHRAGFAALGLQGWQYDAARVPAGGLAGHVAGLGAEWRGLSVTAPLKREALDLADEVTDVARLAGAANTLVRTAAGWVGDNTDVPGAVAAIRERYDGPIRHGLVLGGGATAASTGLALAELGVRRIRIAARDAARAADAHRAVAAHPARPEVSVVDLGTVGLDGEDVVVSTIPVAAQTPDLVARLHDVAVVFDVVYDPWPTPLTGAPAGTVVSGLDLLVHQAVLQFALFTGHSGPLDAMRSAGERVLAAR